MNKEKSPDSGSQESTLHPTPPVRVEGLEGVVGGFTEFVTGFVGSTIMAPVALVSMPEESYEVIEDGKVCLTRAVSKSYKAGIATYTACFAAACYKIGASMTPWAVLMALIYVGGKIEYRKVKAELEDELMGVLPENSE